MELTHEQISEFILKATSNSDGFNQLIEVILNSLMQHERRMFLDESADSGNGFHVASAMDIMSFVSKCLIRSEECLWRNSRRYSLWSRKEYP